MLTLSFKIFINHIKHLIIHSVVAYTPLTTQTKDERTCTQDITSDFEQLINSLHCH